MRTVTTQNPHRIAVRRPGAQKEPEDIQISKKDLDTTQRRTVGCHLRYRDKCKLTPREREVLCYVAAGWGNQQIASELNMNHRTVQTHVGNIFQKTHTTNRVQALHYALREDIISLEEAWLLARCSP